MQISTLDSIQKFESSAWDTLAGDWFYAGHSWAVYQEQDPNSTARYLQVTIDGSVVAATAVYIVEREWSDLYDTRALFPDLHTAYGPGRRILAGNRRGNSSRLLVDRAHPMAAKAMRELVRAVNVIAAQESDGRVWWLYLCDDDAALLADLVPTTTPRILAADCTIELPGTSFADYLATLSRSQRRQVKVDRRVFEGAGHLTKTVAFHDYWGEFAPLVARHERKHGHDVSDAFIGDLMRLQARHCGPTGTLHASWADGEMRAGGLSFTTPTMIAGRAFGFAHPHASASEYFDLFYYRPIEQAYQTSVPRLHLGIGTLATKARRGAQVRPLWGLATGNTDNAGPDAAIQHNRASWQRFQHELAQTPDALASSFISDVC
ncbi:peptidogalycan biosysnthesis protein [Streptomyces sp. NPDC090053]|uniref:peptidogalycan biosysnthesis protein n=1 Tax=Streptomyces sp. NPDC090053 TaxID=3365932 RepID=UPI003826CE2E